MSKSVFLVLTSAIGIGGVLAAAGDVVEVTEGQAVNLLNRGKARLATAEDGVEDDQANEAEEEVKPPVEEKPAGKSKDKAE